MTLYMLASRERNMVPSFLQGPACLQNCNNKFLTLFPPSHLFAFLSCHNLISRNKMHYYSNPKKGTMAKQGCQRCRSFCKGMQKIMSVFIRISIKNVWEEVGKLKVKEGKRRGPFCPYWSLKISISGLLLKFVHLHYVNNRKIYVSITVT